MGGGERMSRELKRSSFCLWRVGLCLLLVCFGTLANLWAQTERPVKRPTLSSRNVAPSAAPTSQEGGQGTALAGITLKENVLTLDVQEQELRRVIEHIATQGGIEVRHAEGLPDKRISVRFDALPLLEGLKRLFRAAELPGYALVTEDQGGQTQVRRILFLASVEAPTGGRASPRLPPSAPTPQPSSASPPSAPIEQTNEEEKAENRSVLEDIKSNTTARRLLSQLVHPNEQVRERALERLIQLVGDDEKQAELLEYIEPLMEQLASEEKEDRDEARADIRKLLQR